MYFFLDFYVLHIHRPWEREISVCIRSMMHQKWSFLHLKTDSSERKISILFFIAIHLVKLYLALSADNWQWIPTMVNEARRYCTLTMDDFPIQRIWFLVVNSPHIKDEIKSLLGLMLNLRKWQCPHIPEVMHLIFSSQRLEVFWSTKLTTSVGARTAAELGCTLRPSRKPSSSMHSHWLAPHCLP